MDGTSILNNKILAAIGNAVLLGYAIDLLNVGEAAGVSNTERSSASRDGPGYYEMLDALEAADLLDVHLQKTLTPALSSLISVQDREKILHGLQKSEAIWASVQFGHFNLSEPVLHEAQLQDALEETGAGAVQEPISLLASSDWRTRLRSFVFSQLVVRALSDLQISAAEYEFIGLDGLVSRRQLSKPPKWSDWNSPQEREGRSRNGFENELLQQANRHILPAALDHMSMQASPESLEEIAHWICKNWRVIDASETLMSSSLSELGAEIHERAHPDFQRTMQLFEDRGALRNGCNDVTGDPLNFLFFAWEQVGLIAVKKRWAMCFALDGLADPVAGWVKSNLFDSIALEEELLGPQEFRVTKVGDLNERILKLSGAGRLRFIIASDLDEFEVTTSSTLPVVHSSSNARPPKNVGFTVTDEPFIQEGLQMLKSGQALSANAAAIRLVEKYGEIIVSEWTLGCVKIRTRSIGETHKRLQRKISKKSKD